VAASSEESSNEPVPLLLHIPPVAIDTDPESRYPELSAQTVSSGPALADGAGVMVRMVVSESALQRPLPVVVSTNCTVPATVSAALGA